MYTLVEEGHQASANTCVFVCDTEEDLKKLKDAPYGSWAKVIEGTQTFIKGEHGWKFWRNEKKTYLELEDKPTINDVEIVGDVTLDDLNLYSKDDVDQLLVSLYRFKGTVDTYEKLQEIQDATIGDVYNVKDTGANWAWDGKKWDNLGAVIKVDATVTPQSTNPVTSQGIYDFVESEIEKRIETIEVELSGTGKPPYNVSIGLLGSKAHNILTHSLTILKVTYTSTGEDEDESPLTLNFLATAETHGDNVLVKATRTDEEGTLIYSGTAALDAFSLLLTPTYTHHTRWQEIPKVAATV